MLVWNERASSLWEVFSDGTNLHAMDLFSGEHRPIVDMNWTPDGRYFLFTVGRGNRFSPFIPVGGDIWAIARSKIAVPQENRQTDSAYNRRNELLELQLQVRMASKSLLQVVKSGESWPAMT